MPYLSSASCPSHHAAPSRATLGRRAHAGASILLGAVGLGVLAFGCGAEDGDAAPSGGSDAGGHAAGGGATGGGATGGGATGGHAVGGGATGGGGFAPSGWALTVDWVAQGESLGIDTVWPVTIAGALDGSLYVAAQDSLSTASLQRLDPSGSPSAGAWPVSIELNWPAVDQVGALAVRPAMVTLPDGSLVVTGHGDFGALSTRRLDTTGAVAWERNFISGAGAYPVGATLDGSGRILVWGFPGDTLAVSQVDCAVIRYGADGSEDPDFQALLSPMSEPPLSLCSAGAFDPTTSSLVLAGWPITSTLTPDEHWALRWVGDDGTVAVDPTQDDLFGPLPWDEWAMPYGAGVLADGTVFTSVSQLPAGASSKAQRAFARADGTSYAEPPLDGSAVMATVADAQLAAWVTLTNVCELRATLSEAGPAGFVDVASLDIDPEADGCDLDWASGDRAGYLWVAWHRSGGGDPVGLRLARLSVVPTP